MGDEHDEQVVLLVLLDLRQGVDRDLLADFKIGLAAQLADETLGLAVGLGRDFNAGFRTLLDTLAADSVGGPFTIFVPSEAAWAKLPPGTALRLALPENRMMLTNILQRHVIKGSEVVSSAIATGQVTTENGLVDVVVDGATGSISYGGANVVNADVEASNGIVHVIDDVLLPDGMVLPLSLLDTVAASTNAAAPEFTVFQSAIQAAGLMNVLNKDALYTVFAPTDAAFNALPDGLLQELLADPVKLADVLLYHIIDGYFTSSQIINTLRGSVFPVESKNRRRDIIDIEVDGVGNIMINSVADVMADKDILASNGIIHSINAVLIPPVDENAEDDNGNGNNDKKNDKKNKNGRKLGGHLRKPKGKN